MPGEGLEVRTATASELPTVLSILDAAMLQTDASAVRRRIEDAVLVAVEEGRILGACVVESERTPAEVVAIAVRPGRRGQGIGTALLETATGRWGRLAVEFDDGARPFYAALGFEIETVEAGRCRGVWTGSE